MKIKVIALICVIMCVNSYTLIGQDDSDFNKYMPPASLSSEVASLHSFVDVPVGYFTGTVDISIPLGTIDIPGLSIPISLNYSSNGIKVDQVASCVGAGWNLQSGGIISENVRGSGDLALHKGYAKVGIDKFPAPFYGFEELTYEQLLEISGAYTEPARPAYDTEPDVFYYSYPGSSGKFVYDRFGSINLIPKKPILIIPPSDGGYKIIDEKGNVYTFKQGGGSISEYEPDNLRQTDFKLLPNKNRTYYLSSIKSPSGALVTYEYEGESSSYSYDVLTKYQNNSLYCGPQVINPEHGLVHSSFGEKRVRRIFTNTGQKIEFIYNNLRLDAPCEYNNAELMELNQVIIYYNNKLVKKYNLEHGYFEAKDPGSIDYKNKRLSLLKVYQLGQPGYEFSYYNSTLTSKLNSYSQDLFGYNNGASNLSSMVPPQANRNLNIEYLKAGTLSKIKYPTGGWTDFEFEANTGESDNRYIGGLRIWSIKEYDYDNSLLKSRYFEYTKPETDEPSGIQNSNPVYIQTLSRFTTKTVLPTHKCDLCNYQVIESRSHTSANLSGVSGGNAYYQYVTELIGPEGTGGKTIYEYTSYRDKGNSAIRPGIPETDYSWARGKLLSTTHFEFRNGQFYLVSKEINNYHWEHDFTATSDSPTFNSENFIGGCRVDVYYPQCSIIRNDVWAVFDANLGQAGYHHISAWFYLAGKETRSYKPLTDISNVDNSDYFISTSQNFDYSQNSYMLKASDQLTSDGNIIATTFKRPLDYSIGLGSQDNSVLAIKKMQDDHILDMPIEIIKTRNSSIMNGSLTLYEIDGFSHIVPIESKRLEIDGPLDISNIILSSVNQSNNFTYDNRYSSVVFFKGFDTNCNLISFHKADNLPTSYLYGYQKSIPVAKVVNASGSIVNNTITETSIGNLIYSSETSGTINTSFITNIINEISLEIYYQGDPGDNKTSNFQYILTGPSNKSGQLCICSLNNGCFGLSNSITFKDMPAGSYSLSIFPNSSNAECDINIKFQYSNQISTQELSVEAYYEGFEEHSDGTLSTNASPSFAGRYYKLGDFQVPFVIPNSRTYVVEYHFWDGSKWVNIKKPYVSLMNLTEGTAIDEIRVYPSDCEMTTYTYDPSIGMTSSSDENNITTFYEYDNLGRLELVRDNDGNIHKTYDYHYHE